MGVGGWEVLVILFVVLLVFGPKRIPEVSRGLGKGMRELRRVTTEFQRELNLEAMAGEEEAPRAPAPREESVARTSAAANADSEPPVPPANDSSGARNPGSDPQTPVT